MNSSSDRWKPVTKRTEVNALWDLAPRHREQHGSAAIVTSLITTHTACSQWRDSCYILQYVHLMNYVRNDEVRRTTGQQRLSAIVQAWRLSLFGHIARMPDETDARGIITASPSENWRRPPGRPRTTWMKIIQPLRSNNLSLNEARTVAKNRPLWRLMSASGATHP